MRCQSSVQWRGDGRRTLGPDTHIGARTVIEGADGSELKIGRGVWIGADCELSAGSLHIGPACSLQHRTQLHGDVRVGAGLVGAAGIYASSGEHRFREGGACPIHLQDRAARAIPWEVRSAPIEIGEDCWLGLNVAIMRGVTVGRGCVVGANSVVTRDLPPYSIAAGTPARVIGQRLDYRPPAAIDACEPAHLPYFHEGFDLWPQDPSAHEPILADGGWVVAAPRFLLALAPAAKVELTIVATRPLALSHGGDVRQVAPGTAKLTWPAKPDRLGRLVFELAAADAEPLATHAGADHGLRLRAAAGLTQEADT